MPWNWTTSVHKHGVTSFSQTSIYRTFTVDGLIANRNPRPFTVDSLIAQRVGKNFSVDSILKTTPTVNPFNRLHRHVIAQLDTAKVSQFSVDAILTKTQTRTFSVDSL